MTEQLWCTSSFCSLARVTSAAYEVGYVMKRVLASSYVRPSGTGIRPLQSAASLQQLIQPD